MYVARSASEEVGSGVSQVKAEDVEGVRAERKELTFDLVAEVREEEVEEEAVEKLEDGERRCWGCWSGCCRALR